MGADSSWWPFNAKSAWVQGNGNGGKLFFLCVVSGMASKQINSEACFRLVKVAGVRIGNLRRQKQAPTITEVQAQAPEVRTSTMVAVTTTSPSFQMPLELPA